MHGGGDGDGDAAGSAGCPLDRFSKTEQRRNASVARLAEAAVLRPSSAAWRACATIEEGGSATGHRWWRAVHCAERARALVGAGARLANGVVLRQGDGSHAACNDSFVPVVNYG